MDQEEAYRQKAANQRKINFEEIDETKEYNETHYFK